jgi:hypothetical protein
MTLEWRGGALVLQKQARRLKAAKLLKSLNSDKSLQINVN